MRHIKEIKSQSDENEIKDEIQSGYYAGQKVISNNKINYIDFSVMIIDTDENQPEPKESTEK